VKMRRLPFACSRVPAPVVVVALEGEADDGGGGGVEEGGSVMTVNAVAAVRRGCAPWDAVAGVELAPVHEPVQADDSVRMGTGSVAAARNGIASGGRAVAVPLRIAR